MEPSKHKGEAQLSHAGSDHPPHADHHAHMAADFRKRFWISVVLTVPILAINARLLKIARS